MAEHTGWLLDVYADARDGAVLWLLGDDGQRVRLHQPLEVTFFAAGPPRRLRALWRFLQEQPEAPKLARTQGRDLFLAEPLDVLAAALPAAAQPELFRRAAEAFPDLTYYNADVPIHLHHAARYGTFPLARCRVEAGEDGQVAGLEVLDSPWDLDPEPAPLRVMYLEPDCNPHHAPPGTLEVRCERTVCRLALEPVRPLLANLRALLRQHDPDLLMTGWGDTWLLPRLVELSREAGIDLPLNREAGRGVARREERSYFSYGQIVFRGAQVHLFGRWHIDRANAMLWDDYDLDGVLEAARVTSTPVQACARLSPGSGISAMQVLTALRTGVMVPWHKQQPESFKTAMDLLHSDMGGLVYQPVIGLHRDVAEIDFISMYPSVMVRCNISPETKPIGLSDPPPEQPGLIPQTLAPLLKKRVALKRRMLSRPAWDPGRKADKARVSAHKWLLVTCFGYLGYKNARFGRIEAHEAVTAYGREALMRAKEAAEDLGGEVLHLYVDGVWVKNLTPPAPLPDAGRGVTVDEGRGEGGRMSEDDRYDAGRGVTVDEGRGEGGRESEGNHHDAGRGVTVGEGRDEGGGMSEGDRHDAGKGGTVGEGRDERQRRVSEDGRCDAEGGANVDDCCDAGRGEKTPFCAGEVAQRVRQGRGWGGGRRLGERPDSIDAEHLTPPSGSAPLRYATPAPLACGTLAPAPGAGVLRDPDTGRGVTVDEGNSAEKGVNVDEGNSAEKGVNVDGCCEPGREGEAREEQRSQKGAAPEDFQPILEAIAERTGLPVALDGIYRWVAFLPARRDARIPVANRYFGVFQDGSIKIRGIEARRRDTPPFVAAAQMEILELLASAPDADELPGLVPRAVELVRARLRQLRARQVPLEDLLAAQKLSRELERYTTPSPAARAAAQLKQVGKEVRPGQRVRLLFLRGEPDVWAWDLPERPNPAAVDTERYATLLVRAASAVLQPLGVDEAGLKERLSGGVAVRFELFRGFPTVCVPYP